jgi:hypothetical protein
MADTRHRLLETIEREAFDPILKAQPEDYPESKRAELDDVQEATCSARKRYHNQASAAGVYREYRDDLSSEAAKKTSGRLRIWGCQRLGPSSRTSSASPTREVEPGAALMNEFEKSQLTNFVGEHWPSGADIDWAEFLAAVDHTAMPREVKEAAHGLRPGPYSKMQLLYEIRGLPVDLRPGGPYG